MQPLFSDMKDGTPAWCPVRNSNKREKIPQPRLYTRSSAFDRVKLFLCKTTPECPLLLTKQLPKPVSMLGNLFLNEASVTP